MPKYILDVDPWIRGSAFSTQPYMIKGQVVDSEGRPCCLTGARVIEPNAGFVDKTGVMVARALVDGGQGEVAVQLLNRSLRHNFCEGRNWLTLRR